MASNDVMISYSRKDKAFVQKLDEALRQAGLDPWVDWEDIPPTVDWMDRIQDGIAGANAFVFVISPDSVASEICREEFNYAYMHNKRMVPLLHREIDASSDQGERHTRGSTDALNRAYAALGFDSEGEEKAKEIRKILSAHNWIFFREKDDFQEAVNTLVEAIKTDYEYLEEHTRLLGRAREWEKKGSPNSSLLVDEEVRAAETWLTTSYQKTPHPTDLHLKYITASRQNRDSRQRLLLIGVSVAFLVMLVLAILSIFLFSEADSQRKLAEEKTEEANARALIANAQLAFANEDPDLALALALEANRGENPLLEAQRAVFEIASAPAARRVVVGHAARIWGLDISPDGQYVLSGSGRLTILEPVSDDNTLRLWNVETGEEIRRFGENGIAHEDTVFTVAFSPDGRTALSGSLDGNIILWDIEIGEEIRRYTDHEDLVLAIAISSDGKTFLSGGGRLATEEGDTVIRLWDIETGEILRRFDDGQEAVFSLDFSPDGKSFVSSGGNLFTNGDAIIRLWDVENGDIIRRFVGHSAFVFDVDFNSDGTKLVSASGNPFIGAEDTTVRLWDVETGSQLLRINHGDTAASVAFSPDDSTFATASFDGSVRVWDAESGDQLLRFTGHSNVVLRVVFSPDGNRLMSSSADNTMRLWTLESGAEISRITGHPAGIYAVRLTGLASEEQSGYVIASGDTNGNLLLSDTGSGEILDQVNAGEPILGLAISPDGTKMLSAGGVLQGGTEYTITFWNIEDKKLQRIRDYGEGSTGHTEAIRQIVFSPDGTQFVSASQDATLILWDIESGEILQQFEGHTDLVYDVVFSPDGNSLFSASWDKTLIQWDIASGEIVQRFGKHTEPVWGLDISPDGTKLVSGSQDTTMILWDIQSGQSVGDPFVGHSSIVSGVAFSPDGKTILSSSWDNTLILWDVATGKILRRYSGHRDSVWSPRFSPDGKFIFSSSFDQTIRIWSVQTLDELLHWTCENRIIHQLNEQERERFSITASTPVCGEIASQ